MLQEIFDKLDKLYSEGNSDAVEKFLKLTIASMEANEEEDKSEYVSILNELAGFYRGTSRYAESMELFSKALKIMEGNNAEDTPAYATVLLNLAGLYRLTGRT